MGYIAKACNPGTIRAHTSSNITTSSRYWLPNAMEINMPTHNAYVSGSDFKTGSVISVATKAFELGDTLSIEFPDKTRASGAVTSASPNEIEIDINRETWRLRPHAPSDGTVHNNLAGTNASFWTVQTKV